MKIWNLFQKKEHYRPRIYTCSIYDDVEILGQVFHGLQDIMSHVEISMAEGSYIGAHDCEPAKRGKVHVGELWKRYPCFDSSDDMYEDRSYRNYIFRQDSIDEYDLKKLERLPWNENNKRISPSVPQKMLPIVYYEGDGNTMIVELCERV